MRKTKKKTPILEGVKRSLGPILGNYPVRRAAVFGSVARGTSRPLSDLDLLVEFERPSGIGLFEFVRLKKQLEKKTGRMVDLVTPEALHPLLRNEILSQQKIIYEKGG